MYQTLSEDQKKKIESDSELLKMLSDWKEIRAEEKEILAKKKAKKTEIKDKLINLTEETETLNQRFHIPTLNLWFRFDKFPDYPLLEGQQRGYHIKLVIAPIVKRR